MKTLLLFLLMMFSVTKISAQNKTDEISKIINQQETDWNKNDMKSFSNAFSDDGILINFLGLVWKGKKMINEQFSYINDCCIKPTSVKFEVTGVKVIDDKTAIAYINETLTAKEDYQVPGATVKKGSIDKKIVTAVFQKESKSWKIVSMQVTQVNQMMTK
ncbi:SgcJ/EcaC family oxidoreductase [Chryseobacterium chendengshani]|uniref:SgcJ/EcaC family oxidoreductase n=1 Tax=Chryseobacterium sp. LJ668 TaxID=2864040 RepID=UPI001C6937E3|nr:SgcJ/EcaC family oxidoreductase [Chryseobacterium sp. LJ668]MBW8524219.1 SgcJ/EcaC family oxidoreductase [Chryseobacterium sp. LJ668]QYK17149.1 SgcJ/EcaC family oxidoreductase [Chryseobacterium sp. LJ668]